MSIIDEESIHPSHPYSARLSDQSNESPDIGPPPIAHFDHDDPIAFDHNMSAPGSEPLPESTEQDALPPSLSVNLETRRKRRETGNKQDVLPRMSSPNKPTDSTSSDRPGIKRKLSIMDAEEPDALMAKDDFVFSRKPIGTVEGRRATISKDGDASDPSKPNQTSLAGHPLHLPPQNERRVLGESKHLCMIHKHPRRI